MAQNKQFINTAQLQEWGYDSPKIGDIVKFNDRFWELESKKDDLWWVRAIVVEEIFKSLPTLPENPKSGG